MQRWSALALVGILLACAALLVLRVGPTMSAVGPAAAPSGPASSSAGPAGSAMAPLGADLALPGLAVDPAPLEEPDPRPAGSQLPGGEPAPPLPEGAPKSVVFGVVLVEYRGAQGANRRQRDRAAAQTLAAELADQARKDFASAVAKGDPGSAENAGAMPRGVLEPGPEHILFSLAVGEVGGPVDTPRGFWIVKRLE
jgi:hypothetical protein